MNFWERRRVKKAIHHLLHEARHARHMREDVVAPDKIIRLLAAEDALKAAWDEKNAPAIDQAADEVGQAVHAILPPHRSPRMRENIEIIVVAIAVAMAFRTFFIQPFRIPTGSMQPTLYGITYEGQAEKKIMDRFPLFIVSFLINGERYSEIRAKASGVAEYHGERTDESHVVIRIGGVPHVVPNDMPLQIELRRQQITKGDIIASGRKRLGDHIFVNRLWYNFFPPERGDIFVFSTKDIKHPNIRPDNYYIKRMVGMPGEKIQIQPPYLVANGEKVTEPPAFVRQVTPPYDGYILVGNVDTVAKLRRAGDSIQLGPDEYLPFGDNTKSSLDGRYFGGVDKHSIIGPAFMIYWPFSSRWGFVE